MTVPAVVLGRFNDILGWNRAGHLLMAPHLDAGARPNQLKLLFADPRARELYVDCDKEAELAVASLRYIAGLYPDDPCVVDLVGELREGSADFARLWEGHEVRLCTRGTKRMNHPLVGHIEVNYQVAHLPEPQGVRLSCTSRSLAATPRQRSCGLLRVRRRAARMIPRPSRLRTVPVIVGEANPQSAATTAPAKATPMVLPRLNAAKFVAEVRVAAP